MAHAITLARNGRSTPALREADLLGWRWLETLHPDDREPTRRFWLDSVAGHHSYDIEYRVRRRDGEYRWFKTRGVPIRDTGGNIVKWFGTCTDITELRDSEERFRGTFENAAVGIAHRASRPAASFASTRSSAPSSATPARNCSRRPSRTSRTPTTWPPPSDCSAALMRGDSPGFTLEKRYLRKDGSPVWVELSVSLQRDAAGKPAYAIGVVQDISERKRLEAELRQAKEAAEAANRAKDEFLANVSHEIRTPMNAILGMTELVLDTPLDEDQRQGLKTVKSAADSLLGIINDLLDFSKIEAGKLELVPADFSLRGAVGDTLRALAVRAHKKGLELIYQVQPDVPDALIGDAGRLRQVLLNLAGNAVKFTDEGEVVVRVEIAGRRPSAVSGSGGGRPPLHGARHRHRHPARPAGAHLPGLRAGGHLHHAQVRRHRPGPDHRLPAGGPDGRDDHRGQRARAGAAPSPSRRASADSRTPRSRSAAQPPVSLHNLPVLVVDDNATNRHILAEWLRGWQMDPTAVGDGMAAMDALWHRAANGRPYALVLLDARMPDADGLTVAAMIRERAELAATRIILLTSGERPGDPARFRELRIDAQLLKPVQQDELLETIYRVMSRSQGNAPPLAWPTPATATPPYASPGRDSAAHPRGRR